jgi:hypothetical protein
MAYTRKASSQSVRKPVDEVRRSEIQLMINDLDPLSRYMNQWETDFFESISDSFPTTGFLTENQYNSLDKMHKRLVR